MSQQPGRLTLGLLPGDGIGKEVVPAAASVLEVLLGSDVLETRELDAGWGTFERTGTALPESTVEGLEHCDGALLGAVSSPSHRVDGYQSPVVAVRKRFDLYANLRPLRSLDGSIDLLVVRENTEGMYAGRESQPDKDTAIAERVITRRATERITRVACQAAIERARESGRKANLTIVHKANVLRLTDGLFREVALETVDRVRGETGETIEVAEQLVDSMAYRLILEAGAFDVIVAPNLYGDILSDAGAALVGGLGLVPSANCSDTFCVAEPVHGSAPDIEGRGVANPIATLRAASLLLTRLARQEEADRLSRSIDSVLRDGPRTPDQGGRATTDEVTREVLDRLSIPTARSRL